jgi:hypothetical protein
MRVACRSSCVLAKPRSVLHRDVLPVTVTTDHDHVVLHEELPQVTTLGGERVTRVAVELARDVGATKGVGLIRMRKVASEVSTVSLNQAFYSAPQIVLVVSSGSGFALR